MASNDATIALDGFLAAHAPIDAHPAFAQGEMFGDWRVTAFLGRGGSGEVYRVVHAALGTAAALKVCVRDEARNDACDAAVRDRFRQEAKLLAKNTHPAFPRFLGFGERDSRPWYVMELLEYKPLPTVEKDIVSYLIAIASGVRHLHSLGLVHRDIKPSNILWRDSCPVLIDLGLAKDMSVARGHAGESLSIVDGKTVGVGTPRYAAPEQMSGDEISPATDVYALGMLANDCFGGKPPRKWQRIIQRATAAIPAQRYATVDLFIRAIRIMMFWEKTVWTMVCVLSVMAMMGLLLLVTKSPLPSDMYLNGKTVVIDRPVILEGGKTYRITGPGTLDADISGPTNALLRLKDCVILNRTKAVYPENGLQYSLENGVYLNFVNIKKAPLELRRTDYLGSYDGAFNEVRFGGPETAQVLESLRGRGL